MSLANGLFVAAGFLFLALGIVGIVLPILPTTPFLLAASFCFLRGSPRLHRWIMANPYFGPRIRRISEQGLTRREKISIYLFVLAILTPLFILTKSPHLRIALAAAMLIKAVVFLRIKTAPPPATSPATPTPAAEPAGALQDAGGSGGHAE